MANAALSVDCMEQEEAFQEIFGNALDKSSAYKMADFLEAEFDGKDDLYWQFIDFCFGEFIIPSPETQRQRHNLQKALAIAGFVLGYKDGLETAKRIYFQGGMDEKQILPHPN